MCRLLVSRLRKASIGIRVCFMSYLLVPLPTPHHIAFHRIAVFPHIFQRIDAFVSGSGDRCVWRCVRLSAQFVKKAVNS